MYLGQQKILNTKEDGDKVEIYLEEDKLEVMPKDLFEKLKTEDKSEDMDERKFNYIGRIIYTVLLKYNLSAVDAQDAIAMASTRAGETVNKAILRKFGVKEYAHGSSDYHIDLALQDFHDVAYPED